MSTVISLTSAGDSLEDTASAGPVSPTGPARTTTPRVLWARPHRDGHDVELAGCELLRELGRDWVRTTALPSARRTLVRWARTQPALDGIESLSELLDVIDASGPDRTDELLLALIALNGEGEDLAGRTLLQALLPALSAMTLRTLAQARATNSGPGRIEMDQICQDVVAEFWTVLSTFPQRRRSTHGIWANLTLDTLNRVKIVRQISVSATPIGIGQQADTDHLADTEYDLVARDCGDQAFASLPQHDAAVAWRDPCFDAYAETVHDQPTPDVDLTQMLAWARRENVLSDDQVDLLALVYQHPDSSPGAGVRAACAELGVGPRTVHKRCSRAVAHLRCAVAAG